MQNQKVFLITAVSSALVMVCSCGNQAPARPSATTSVSRTPISSTKSAAGKSDQAVLVHVKLADAKFGTEDERSKITVLEAGLTRDIAAAGVGEYDGNEVGGGEYTLYAYGPDARRLADVVRPTVLKASLATGSYMIIRAGPPGAPQTRETLAGSAPTATPGSAAAVPPAAPPGPPGGRPGVGSAEGTEVVVPKGFDVSLVDILACPEDKTPVRLASRRELDEINTKIREGKALLRNGATRSKALEALLIRQDGKLGYVIQNGVPVMLVDLAIVLQPGAELPGPERTGKPSR